MEKMLFSRPEYHRDYLMISNGTFLIKKTYPSQLKCYSASREKKRLVNEQHTIISWTKQHQHITNLPERQKLHV